MVEAIFATISGCTSGTWQMAKTVTYRVIAPSAAAHVKLSNVVELKSDGPPYPRQRPTGSKHSMPDWPTACAISIVSGQLSLHASGTVVIVEPWLQLNAMTPSFMRLPPNSRARAVMSPSDRMDCITGSPLRVLHCSHQPAGPPTLSAVSRCSRSASHSFAIIRRPVTPLERADINQTIGAIMASG